MYRRCMSSRCQEAHGLYHDVCSSTENILELNEIEVFHSTKKVWTRAENGRLPDVNLLNCSRNVGHFSWAKKFNKGHPHPYRFTSVSLIVTTRQYVGNPIDCVHTKDIPEDVLNTYCWIHSTYTVRGAFYKKVGVDVPYPGVETAKNESEKKLYRQWKQRVGSFDYPSSLEDDCFSLASSGRSMDSFGSLENIGKLESKMDEPIASTSARVETPLEESSDQALHEQILNDTVQQIKSGDYVVVVHDD
ncbi:Innexin [Popillia japonica]|uniref:Innexin n=1 Tax=Popillia japonica TaxID=7064 RepID=A0AAW1MEK3_POPJA